MLRWEVFQEDIGIARHSHAGMHIGERYKPLSKKQKAQLGYEMRKKIDFGLTETRRGTSTVLRPSAERRASTRETVLHEATTCPTVQ